MKTPRWRVHALWAAVAVLAALTTWWATATVLSPAGAGGGEADATTDRPTVTVAAGEVSRSVTTAADVAFQPGPVGAAAVSGTVTTVDVKPGATIRSGDIVATVDLRPVVAATGAIPSFRDLRRGSEGPDVQQLRRFLGLSAGSVFDTSTEQAVRRWQRQVGFEVDGWVHRGDLLFLPRLPARASPADGVRVGAQVSAGEALVTTVLERPTITVLQETKGAVLTTGLPVTFRAGGKTISAALGEPATRDDGLPALSLLDAQGEPACNAECAASFPPTGATTVTVTIELVPATRGLVVPDSAVLVRPDGSSVLVGVDGEIPVTVVASAQGKSVVEGVAEGTSVQLFGAEPTS